MATDGSTTYQPLHESFDNGIAGFTDAWNVDTSVPGQVTFANAPYLSSGMLEPALGPSSGHGYGTYTVHAMLTGNMPGSAIMLWPGDNQYPGQEIDMVEMANDGSGHQYGALHWKDGIDRFEVQFFNNVATGVFHDYQAIWEPGLLTYKVDGVTQAMFFNHVPVDYAHGGMNNVIGFLNNNPNTTLTVTQVDYVPWGSAGDAATSPVTVTPTTPTSSTPVAVTPAPMVPISPATTTLGTGPDTLVLKLTQDAYQGSAQFNVFVDGVKFNADPLTVSAAALHGSGVSDSLTLNGDFGGGAHTVSVDFLNDAYGGSAQADRNLYVDGITFDDNAVAGGPVALAGGTATLLGNGAHAFAFTDVSAAPVAASGTTTTLGTGPDALALKLTQDAYQGSAQFNVFVDGVKFNASPLTVSAAALHGSGVSDSLTLNGDFGGGAHTVSVDFLNDAYGGSAQADRNLYVDGITFDDNAVAGGPVALAGGTATLLGNGAHAFAFTDVSAAPVGPVVTLGTGAHTLSLKISQDAYLGNAQYDVSIDGVKQNSSVLTASSAHGSGVGDTLQVLGNFAAGAHTVTVTFLNDLYQGSAQADRNLYVDSMSYDNVAVAGGTAALLGTGPHDFIFH